MRSCPIGLDHISSSTNIDRIEFEHKNNWMNTESRKSGESGENPNKNADAME